MKGRVKVDYRKIIKHVKETGRGHLLETEAYQVCDAFGIVYPRYQLVSNINEGIEAAKSMGFPVVIKVVSPQVLHKSDVGGVIVGIQSEEEFKSAYTTLFENVRSKAPGTGISGVLVQKAMPRGVEIVVGGLRDPQFGPVVMFGSGGVLIEVFKDVSFRLAPLDREEALRQIKETKAFKILQGVRGNKPCNVEAVADLIVRAGNLLVDVPEISELDFNPVLAYPNEYFVVDARMILSGLGGTLSKAS